MKKYIQVLHISPLVHYTLFISIIFFTFLIIFFNGVNSLKCYAETPTLKAGFGETIITPAGNVQMSGFARSQVSTGVHDDLHARSIVIESENGTAIVMMALALVGLDLDLDQRIRTGIEGQTGIPKNQILIICTHTHAGPDVEKAGEKYSNFLVKRSIASTVTAWKNRFPARIGISSTEVMELGKNRRRLLYGGLHPDSEVGIIKIEDVQGKLKGVLFNYGCHPAALDWHNQLFSEDWPLYAIKGIKKSLGEDIWVAYVQSAEGDINVGYLSELSAVGVDMPIRNYWYIEQKGNQMVDALLKALPSIKTSEKQEIKTATDSFDYPLREKLPFTLEQAERDAKAAERNLAEMEKKPELQGTRILDKFRAEVFSTGLRLQTAKNFYTTVNRPRVLRIMQQAFRIGDAVFVLTPGETFSEIGKKIKEQSPFEKTFIVGLNSGRCGYLPTEKEFIEGDYEVDSSKYDPTAERVCIKSCLELIRRVERGN